MKTSPGRALVPAVGAALAAPVLLVITTLISEGVGERRLDSFDAAYLWFGQGLAPLGWTGMIIDARVDGDQIAAMLTGLVVLALVVFAVTWLTASSLTPGSWALPVFVGGWLASVVGGGLAGLSAALILHRTVSDIRVEGPSAWYFAHYDFMNGVKWGFFTGFLVGLLALVLWLARRPRATAPAGASATPQQPWATQQQSPVDDDRTSAESREDGSWPRADGSDPEDRPPRD